MKLSIAIMDTLLVLRWFVFEIMLPLILLAAAGCAIMGFFCCVAQGIEALVAR